MKKNCWEYKNCGRQRNGPKVMELGVCPASTDSSNNGINHGHNSGRYCWKLAGTLCGGAVQGSFASKMLDCLNCDFFHLVQEQEGLDFIP